MLICCNERRNLEALLPCAERALAGFKAAEIVLVDDGSTDDTRAWLAGRTARVALRVVGHAHRRGYGAAVRTGLAAAHGERVVYMDGDGQYDPAQISELVLLLDSGHDVVAGVRADRSDPVHRRLIGEAYNLAVRALLGLRFRDLDCGFKVLSRRALDAIELELDGNLIGPELMGKCAAAGLSIHQVPVRHAPREHGTPKGVDVFALVQTGRELARAIGALWPLRQRR